MRLAVDVDPSKFDKAAKAEVKKLKAKIVKLEGEVQSLRGDLNRERFAKEQNDRVVKKFAELGSLMRDAGLLAEERGDDYSWR